MKAEAEHAALLARAAALKKRQEFDAEELKLKAKREHVEMETEIAANNARLKILSEYEDARDDMSNYYQSHRNNGEENKKDFFDPPLKEGISFPPPLNTPSLGSCSEANALARQIPVTRYSQQLSRPEKDLHKIMQRQNEVTELLVMQQGLSQIPQRAVPVFSGDPLSYRSFMRAFESAIEKKT